MNIHSKVSRPLLMTALALTLAACGQHSDKTVATQVAAKVGSEEISVHQINQVLAGRSALDAIHLIGHGSAGSATLGSTLLTDVGKS